MQSLTYLKTLDWSRNIAMLQVTKQEGTTLNKVITNSRNMAKKQNRVLTQEDFKSEFDICIEDRLRKTNELLLIKGKEYIRGEDRFHNFNRAAEMNRTTPTKALHGMLSKHLVSILDMLDDIEQGKFPATKVVEEKLGDAIVYLHLQEALIKSKYTQDF